VAAIEAFLLDPQLPIDTCEAVKFGAVRTYMGLVDKVIANRTCQDVEQASILLSDSSR